MRLILILASLAANSLAHAQSGEVAPAVLVPGGPGTSAPVIPGGAPAVGTGSPAVGTGSAFPGTLSPGAPALMPPFDPNSGYSVIYPPAEDPSLLEDEEAEEDGEEEEEEEAAGGFDLGKMLQGMGSATGGGAPSGGQTTGSGTMKYGDRTNSTGSVGLESTALETCGQPPQSVKDAFNEAIAYRNSCNVANRGDGQKIVINDYSGTNRGMYIFEPNGTCLKKTAVTYGSGGAGANGAMPCSASGAHATPPGFHLTAKNFDGSASGYDSTNSLRMYSLQRQGSSARGVIIHGSSNAKQNLSWGCAGVGCITDIMRLLGSGSLVYNYFGDKGQAPGCGNSTGMRGDKTCEMEGGNAAIPPGVTDVIDGGSEGATQ